MKWQDAVKAIESCQESSDPELLTAAKSVTELLTKLMRRKKRMITVGNVTLPLREWAKRTGITPAAIYGRLNAGWSEQDAVSMPHQTDGQKFGGKTLPQHAKDSGLSKYCIYARLQRGWSIEEAISTPKHIQERKQS